MDTTKAMFVLLAACNITFIKPASHYSIIAATPDHDVWNIDLESARGSTAPTDIYASTESLSDRSDYHTLALPTTQRCPKVNWCTTAKCAAGAVTILGAAAGFTYFASWLGPELTTISGDLPAIRESLAILTEQGQVLQNLTETLLKIVSDL
jgi:hypothetical protein